MLSILCMLRYTELAKQIPALWRRKCYNFPSKLYLFPGKTPAKQQTTVQTALSTSHQLSLRTQQVLQAAPRQEDRTPWVHRCVCGRLVVTQRSTTEQYSLSTNKWQESGWRRETQWSKEEREFWHRNEQREIQIITQSSILLYIL